MARPLSRYLRINLRMLFVFMTVCALWLGYLSKRALDQRAAVQRIRELGGTVSYDFQYADGEANGKLLKKPRPPGWPWLRRMIGDEYFQRVVKVGLDEKSVADADLILIGKLRHLNSLSLTRTAISDDGLQHLGQLKRLESLGLGGTKITSEGLRIVGTFNNLETLVLEYASGVNDDGMAHVTRLPRLDTLALSGTSIRSAGLSHLKTLENLYLLTLMYTAIDDAAIPHLSQLPRVGELHLQGTKISGTGLIELRDRLPSCQINDDAMDFQNSDLDNKLLWQRLLARMTALHNEHRLKMVDFRNTQVADDHLLALHNLDRLEAIDLRNTPITTQAIERMQRALPHCTVVVDAPTPMTK